MKIEEIVIVCVIGFVALQLINSTSATRLAIAKAQANSTGSTLGGIGNLLGGAGLFASGLGCDFDFGGCC